MNIPFKPRQYCGQSTEVPWAKYCSTLGKVLKYSGRVLKKDSMLFFKWQIALVHVFLVTVEFKVLGNARFFHCPEHAR